MPDYFDPDDVAENEYILLRCPNDPNEPCWFKLPKIEDTVWLAKVNKIEKIEGTTDYRLLGWFFYNTARDLTKELLMRDYIECIDMKEGDIVGVFEPDEHIKLNKTNINQIIKFMKQQEIE